MDKSSTVDGFRWIDRTFDIDDITRIGTRIGKPSLKR